MKGIRKTPTGYQAFVFVGGRFYSKRFPKDTDLTTMRHWREGRRVQARIDAKLAPKPGGKDAPFEADVDTYLAAVATMPTIKGRTFEMRQWVTAFEGRRRDEISPLEIRSQLELWATRREYEPSTVNKLRTALMSFYTVLNGKSGYNPVRDVKRYHEAVELRSQSMWTIYRVLALMPPSKTRARLRVILWTGWPHKQIKQLRPEHLNLKAGLAYVTPRRKGRGKAGAWLPLLRGAVVALEAFDREDCYTPIVNGKPRPFSNSSMHRAFEVAVEKYNAHRARFKRPPVSIRPYDLRHAFGTYLAERTTDDRAIQELMLHSTAAQTRRYTEAATAARVRTAIAQIDRQA